MSDTKHTPTPWAVKAPRIPVGRDREGDRLVFSEKTKEHVAEVFQYRNDDHKDETTSRANAEFIVRACNAHDDLLAALQASRRTMQTIKDNTGCSGPMTLEQAHYKLRIMDGLLHERLKLLDAAIAKEKTAKPK